MGPATGDRPLNRSHTVHTSTPGEVNITREKSMRSIHPGLTKTLGAVAAVVLWTSSVALGLDPADQPAMDRNLHPYPLFPSEPVPGRTGFGTRELERSAQSGEIFSESIWWGHPQFLPYEGSVEHVRHEVQRYVPPYPVYNHTTLTHSFVLGERESLRDKAGPFEEPVFWHTQWQQRIATSKRRVVTPVYPWAPGASIPLELGNLRPRHMYAVRVIGALRPEDAKPADGMLKQLIFELTVNDQTDGRDSTYVLRGRANENFYETVLFKFHALDERDYHVSLRLLPESEATLYTYNVDVHDIFGQTAAAQGKKQATLSTPAQRQQVKANLLEVLAREGQKAFEDELRNRAASAGDLARSLLRASVQRVLGTGTAIDARQVKRYVEAPRMAGDARRQRDEALWHGFPPLNITFDGRSALAAGAGWNLSGRGATAWDKPFSLRRDADGERQEYTWRDLAAHRPLPGTEDRGWGVTLPPTQEKRDRHMASPLGHAAFARIQQQGKHLNALSELYHLLGDEHAARDAALMLVRLMHQYPSWEAHHSLVYAESGTPEKWPRRYGPGGDPPSGWGSMELRELLVVYDKLFPFIDRDEEVAQAVGRYIPWVKTPEDVKWLLDVYLVQYTANQIMHYRYFYNDHVAPMTILAATVQNSAMISEPWMDFLFTRAWQYPQAMAGVDQNLVTNSTRDGGSTIGSWFYTSEGGPGLSAAATMEQYVRTGGARRFDLADFRVYPESLAGAYFPIETRIAGGHHPGIGDVGGPAMVYRWLFDNAESTVRLGWRYTRDPKFAWLLVNEFGRSDEPDEEWRRIEQAAEGRRDPLLAQRSRVLSDWSGILEGGVEHDDFRFRRAAAVRVGVGQGHHHVDTLDLRLWAFGTSISSDLGQRPAYGRPRHGATYTHNLVEVDGNGDVWTRNSGQWDGYAWIRNLFDAPGAEYLLAETTPPYNHQNVNLYQRHVALIEAAPGTPSKADRPAHDAGVTLPAGYVVDVSRVSGGNRHTYAFHGTVDDNGFEANVKGRRILDEEGKTPEEIYMQRFRWQRHRETQTNAPIDEIDKQWAATPAESVLEATWRLGLGAERRMIGEHGAMTPERKFMRMHLFDVADHRVLHGISTDVHGGNRLNPDIPNYSGRHIYVQKDSEVPLESVYLALLEPYAGEPTITGRRLLEIRDNERDARRAIAAEVQTRHGRRDVVFADGRPDRPRALEDGTEVAGEFALISRDSDGLRQATLTGGTLLKTEGLTLTVPFAEYRGRVTRVDYLDRHVWVEGMAAPAQLAGQFFEIGNAPHRSSFQVQAIVAPQGEKLVRLELRKGLEIMRATVAAANYETGEIVTNIAMLRRRGRDAGLTATNAAVNAKRWPIEFVKGDRHTGHHFRFTGDGGITESDFPVGGRFSVWEFGEGDETTLRTGVSLQRQAPGRWRVTANAPFKVNLAGQALQWSAQGQEWHDVPADQEIGVGRGQPVQFQLRAAQ